MSNLHIESLALYYESAARWCYSVDSDPDFHSLVPRYEDVCYLAVVAPHPHGIFESRALKNREGEWSYLDVIDELTLAEKMFKFL